MTSIKALLPDMPSNSKFHEVRVKVVSKTKPTQNPGKMRYQRLLLRDEAGNTMRMSLFGNDIDVYDQIFAANKFYDILNVSIKEERPGSPYARGKTMYITTSTAVKPVTIQPESTLFQGQFKTIREALALDSTDDIFDLACIVVDVTGVSPQRTHMGTTVDMAKFHVTDDRHPELVDVALWGPTSDFAEAFSKKRNKEGVITLEGLRKSSYAGKTTFNTTHECVVRLQPVANARVNELKAWFDTHEKDVASRLEDSEQTAPDGPPEIVSVCIHKKAEEVTVDKTMQFVANIDDFSDNAVRTSAGCGRCGRAAHQPIGDRFMCPSCKRPTTCVPKLYFDFTVRDATGSLSLSAQTRAAERILGITAHTFYMQTLETRAETLRNLRRTVCSTPRTWIVRPAPQLLEHNNIVKWVLKFVLPEE